MSIRNIVGIFIIFSLFAGNASASFLDDEAGISAYANATANINLNNAKNAFRTIEYQTAEYIIGSVELTGLPKTEDVHVYVSKSGWIVAYYLKNEPVSKIMQWQNYNGGAITTTKLADAITKVAGQAGVGYSPIKYYNFEYPEANRLMIIADLNIGGGTDSFDFKIPSGFTLAEASYSHYDMGHGSFASTHKLDGLVVSTANEQILIGQYPIFITPDVFHIVSLGLQLGYGNQGIATTLVYQEP